MKTAAEIAEIFGVTKQAVGLWVKGGLPYKTIREVGRKAYRVFDPEEVRVYLCLTDDEKE